MTTPRTIATTIIWLIRVESSRRRSSISAPLHDEFRMDRMSRGSAGLSRIFAGVAGFDKRMPCGRFCRCTLRGLKEWATGEPRGRHVLRPSPAAGSEPAPLFHKLSVEERPIPNRLINAAHHCWAMIVIIGRRGIGMRGYLRRNLSFRSVHARRLGPIRRVTSEFLELRLRIAPKRRHLAGGPIAVNSAQTGRKREMLNLLCIGRKFNQWHKKCSGNRWLVTD